MAITTITLTTDEIIAAMYALEQIGDTNSSDYIALDSALQRRGAVVTIYLARADALYREDEESRTDNLVDGVYATREAAMDAVEQEIARVMAEPELFLGQPITARPEATRASITRMILPPQSEGRYLKAGRLERSLRGGWRGDMDRTEPVSRPYIPTAEDIAALDPIA